MARRRAAAPPKAVPTPERVAAALRAGEFLAAVELARRLHEATPTPATRVARKDALAAAAGHFADRDKHAEFARVMAEAEAFATEDPQWANDRAVLLARGGKLADALALADEATRPKVLGHAADRAVRLRSRDSVPPELHAGLDAVLAAFRHHEAGHEAAAREALEPIGLRSPFLEWRVLVRGLLAHAAADDARAAENFARLDPSRLPARLAAPLRVAVDPDFKKALPAETAGQLLRQHERLTAGPVVDALRAIARELGRDRPLGPAFKAAAEAVPLLKQTAPRLIPRLANCLYHAVVQQGQPDDLPRFSRLFGSPPDDPNFHRLHALVGEAIGDLPGAHAHWKRYAEWLATDPPGWPPAVLARARAVVWARMGENARRAAEEPEEEDTLLGFFAPPRRRPRPRRLDPPAEECFRRAADLAPDWPDAARKLFDALVEAKKLTDAEAVARAFLARRPDSFGTLVTLAELVRRQGRQPEAAELWLRAAAANPLDRTTRLMACAAVLAHARRKLTDGDPEAARAILDGHRALLDELDPAGSLGLRSVVLAKLGRPEEAAEARAKALAAPGARLAVAYRVMVDSQLAKLKPAEKKAAEKLFADELAKPPAPLEVTLLVAAYDAYHLDAVTYRGQKTHEKKLLDTAGRCLAADAPERDFERLVELLVAKREWKHAKKLADGCAARFPENPAFLVARAEAGMGTGERPFLVDRRLAKAKQLAERSAEPRHRALLERIDRLMKEVGTPFDFLETFFDELG